MQRVMSLAYIPTGQVSHTSDEFDSAAVDLGRLACHCRHREDVVPLVAEGGRPYGHF
jgi:hypothetical protein